MEDIKKVLLVDDEEVALFLSTVLLKTETQVDGVAVARDGMEALGFLEDNCSASRVCRCKLDLILLDINLPALDGFGFLEEYGRMSLACGPKVVLLTSTDRLSAQEQAEGFNVAGILPKPLNLQALAAILEGAHF